MFNKKKGIVTLLAIPFIGFAQQPVDTVSIQKVLDEVNINALRANEKTPSNYGSNKFSLQPFQLSPKFYLL